MVSVSEEDKLGVGRGDDASDSRIAARASQMVCHEERDEHSGSGKNRKETEWRRGCGKPLAEAAREARGQRYREYPVLADRFPANNWKCKRNEPPCDSSIIESLISVWTPSLSSSFSLSLSLSLFLSLSLLHLPFPHFPRSSLLVLPRIWISVVPIFPSVALLFLGFTFARLRG